MKIKVISAYAHFDVSVDLPGVGSSHTEAFVLANGDRLTISSSEVAELVKLEIVGPVTAAGVREKLLRITPTDRGETFDGLYFNELMIPAHRIENPIGGLPLGKPLFLGGDPVESASCPKYPPDSQPGILAVVPSTAQGGAALTQDFRVYGTFIVADYDEAYTELKARNVITTTAQGMGIDEGFDINDVFAQRSYSLDKVITIKSARELADKWSNLFGGRDVQTPRVIPKIAYARNFAATTPNQAYELTTHNDKVALPWMEFSGSTNQKEAILLEKIGVTPHTNSFLTELKVGETELRWVTRKYDNELPMPLNPDDNIKHYQGYREPTTRRFLAIVPPETKYVLSHTDNGTSIPANQLLIAFYSYKLEGAAKA